MAYKLNIDIKPRGIASAYINAPFDKGKEALEKAGYSIISLEENAILRMQEGANADVSRKGNWTREGVLYIPNKGAYLTKKSPIMQNAQEATQCHRNGKDFYLTDNQVQESLEGALKLEGNLIPTNRFSENAVTAYVFGSQAETYGNFLREAGIEEMPIWLALIQDKPFARQLWFCGLGNDGRSGLYGDGRDLNYDGGVRGVSCGVADSAEGGQKISACTDKIEAYTPAQLKKVLSNLKVSGLEEAILNGLRSQ